MTKVKLTEKLAKWLHNSSIIKDNETIGYRFITKTVEKGDLDPAVSMEVITTFEREDENHIEETTTYIVGETLPEDTPWLMPYKPDNRRGFTITKQLIEWLDGTIRVGYDSHGSFKYEFFKKIRDKNPEDQWLGIECHYDQRKNQNLSRDLENGSFERYCGTAGHWAMPV